MFSELLKSALDAIKLSPRYMFSIAVVAGFLLFTPTAWLSQIGLEKLSQDYRPWLGLALLISATLWIVAAIGFTWNWVREKFARRAIRKHIAEKLESLTEDEKQILRYYIAKNTRANMLRIDNGVVQGLASNHIIYRSASTENLIEGFAHNITDFAWEYLHKNLHVLEGTTNFYKSDKREGGL